MGVSQAQKFLDSLKTIFDISDNGSNHITAPYDQSFMAKNNILGRITIFVLYVNVDLMIVDDAIPITDVPKNFDLSFCKIWYDGQKVYAMHKEDIENNRGTLDMDYMKAFLSGNIFTLIRLFISLYPSRLETFTPRD